MIQNSQLKYLYRWIGGTVYRHKSVNEKQSHRIL